MMVTLRIAPRRSPGEFCGGGSPLPDPPCTTLKDAILHSLNFFTATTGPCYRLVCGAGRSGSTLPNITGTAAGELTKLFAGWAAAVDGNGTSPADIRPDKVGKERAEEHPERQPG